MKYTEKQYNEALKILMGRPKFYLVKFIAWILFREIKIKWKI